MREVGEVHPAVCPYVGEVHPAVYNGVWCTLLCVQTGYGAPCCIPGYVGREVYTLLYTRVCRREVYTLLYASLVYPGR